MPGKIRWWAIGCALTKPLVSDSSRRVRTASASRRSPAARVAPKTPPAPICGRRRERVRAGLPHRAELLGVALVDAAGDGEVLVDPDVDAAGVGLALERAADDDEGLLVLRPHRVEQLLAAAGAGLPVGPDERDGAGVLLGQLQRGRQQLGDPRGVGAVLDGEQVTGVVPRRRRDQGGPASGRPGVEEPLHFGHLRSRSRWSEDRSCPYDSQSRAECLPLREMRTAYRLDPNNWRAPCTSPHPFRLPSRPGRPRPVRPQRGLGDVRHLRREDPGALEPRGARQGSGFWAVTRHEDICAVDKDPETFTSTKFVNLEEVDDDLMEVRRSMLETDGARHRALRKLIQREFSAGQPGAQLRGVPARPDQGDGRRGAANPSSTSSRRSARTSRSRCWPGCSTCRRATPAS